MYDSLFVKCPSCKKELEFQSKSGACGLYTYDETNLPIEVAIGMDKDIARCINCGKNVQLTYFPKDIEIRLKVTNKKADY